MLEEKFLVDFKERWIDAIKVCNNWTSFYQNKWDFVNKAGKAETNINKGELFEKACVSVINAKVVIPGNTDVHHIQWLGVQIFPSNPLIPSFIGVFEHVKDGEKDYFPAVYDIYPVIKNENDHKFLRDRMAESAKRCGKEYEGLAEGYKKMFQLREAGTGVGYGIGIALGPQEKDEKYYEDAANTIFKSYFEIVDRRRNDKPSNADFDAMWSWRAEWTRYVFMENRFFQGGVKVGVPVECFLTHMLPPVVKF